MKVNELATKVGVTPDTIRFYTRVGLLNSNINLGNCYKNNGLADKIERPRVIRRARCGMTSN